MSEPGELMQALAPYFVPAGDEPTDEERRHAMATVRRHDRLAAEHAALVAAVWALAVHFDTDPHRFDCPECHGRDEVYVAYDRRGYELFDAMVAAAPRALSRHELAERSGFTASGGTFGTYLGVLRRNGLIEVAGDEVRVGGALLLTDEVRA